MIVSSQLFRELGTVRGTCALQLILHTLRIEPACRWSAVFAHGYRLKPLRAAYLSTKAYVYKLPIGEARMPRKFATSPRLTLALLENGGVRAWTREAGRRRGLKLVGSARVSCR